MCRFLSAIVLRNGDIICAPDLTDSHEDLISANKLRDDQFSNFLERFVRIEFTPPEDRSLISDLSKWNFSVDEAETPDWFDHEKVRTNLESMVARHIISDNRKILLGGWWILVENAIVDTCKNSVIKIMYGSSQVRTMYGSSHVVIMSDSSQVGTMYGSSQVRTMSDSGQAPKSPTTARR